MMTVVTIGVCVKNCESTIKRAVDSILVQDFPRENIEIIFVDDGSRDKTLDILRDYAQKADVTIKLFRSEWMGLGKARNVVVDNAEGDYIIWVDGDMVLPKDHVRKQVAFMEENPKAGIAKAKYGFVPNESLVAFLENVVDLARDAVGETVWQTDLRLPGTGGSIFRAKAIRQVGGFDDDLRRVGEDQDAAYRIREAGWLIFRSDAVFYERRKVNTWKALWDKNFWYGYDHYRLYRKNRRLFVPYKMVPPASFVAGLLSAHVAYGLSLRKAAFLLPLQYAFKMTAWFCGFIKRQITFHE